MVDLQANELFANPNWGYSNLVWSPRQDRLTLSDALGLWNAQTGYPLTKSISGDVTSPPTFSADGRILLVNTTSAIEAIDAATERSTHGGAIKQHIRRPSA